LRVISYLLYALIVGAGIVLILDKSERPVSTAEADNPCSGPITYHIAFIDDRFDITTAQLRRFIDGVGKLWSDAAGRDLVFHDRNGDVAIHLIYDDRQQLVEDEREISNRIQMERLRFDRVHRQYSRQSEQHEEALQSYNSFLGEYEEKVSEHNAEVDKWNEQGDVPDEVKKRIRDRAEELTRMQNELISLKNEVNNSGKQLEEVIERLNEISVRKDGIIDEYNQQFAGEYRFNQGEFMNVAGEQRINIYHYKSFNHLRLVLAHELGHALGLGHLDYPGSIMYPVVESHGSADVRLSDQDVAAIQSLCR
jgi:hypothetical protein